MTTTPELSDFALALNQLCDQRWPNGSRSANREIAAAVAEHTGRSIDRQYIHRLRNGVVRSVSSEVRDAICLFFDVPLTYFSSPAGDGTLTEQMKAHSLAVAGLRSSELSDEGRRDLERVFEEASAILRRERQ
ncbi:hypothetical protein [Gordonia aichiensis]|uniref:hypothetical protein n=1 Tax=Gordonia aichiensis TaxID=36820 RepID=UPI003267C702